MTYWKDSLLIGVPEIDDQHRRLVAAIDNLMDACAKGLGRASIEKTLAFAASYAKTHFTDEEKLQAKYSYPGLSAHKKMHEQFISTLSTLIADFEKTGPNIALTASINKLLVDWLIRHISIEDKKLGEFIRGKKASANLK